MVVDWWRPLHEDIAALIRTAAKATYVRVLAVAGEGVGVGRRGRGHSRDVWRVVGREVIVVLVEEDVIEENGEDERREATNERLTQKQQ